MIMIYYNRKDNVIMYPSFLGATQIWLMSRQPHWQPAPGDVDLEFVGQPAAKNTLFSALNTKDLNGIER